MGATPMWQSPRIHWSRSGSVDALEVLVVALWDCAPVPLHRDASRVPSVWVARPADRVLLFSGWLVACPLGRGVTTWVWRGTVGFCVLGLVRGKWVTFVRLCRKYCVGSRMCKKSSFLSSTAGGLGGWRVQRPSGWGCRAGIGGLAAGAFTSWRVQRCKTSSASVHW